MRITVIVTETEYAEIKARAGRVPLSRWCRDEILGDRVVSREKTWVAKVAKGDLATANEALAERGLRDAERESQKISKPVVEVTEPVKSGVRVCRHGAEQGAHCWQCRGIAEVEAPKKAKGRGKK